MTSMQPLGHPNFKKLQDLVNNKNIFSSNSLNLCSSCLLGKLSRIPIVAVEHKSVSTHRYFVLFVDIFQDILGFNF